MNGTLTFMPGQMPNSKQFKPAKSENLKTNEDIYASGFDKNLTRSLPEDESMFVNRSIRKPISKIDVGIIDQDLVPTGSLDLGSTANKWRNLWLSGDANIADDINHDGTRIGFFGAAPAVKDSVANLGALTAQTLTDSTTGTANTTVADVGAAFSQATLNNNFADLTAQINLLVADVATLKAKIDEHLDAEQSYGLV